MKDSDGNYQKSVFWDPVGGILLWTQEKSKLPSNYTFSADLIHRLSAPDKKVRSPASTSVSVGPSCVCHLQTLYNNFICYLLLLIKQNFEYLFSEFSGQ